MRRFWAGGCLLAGLFFAQAASAQVQNATESLLMTASEAYTWMEDNTRVVQMEGPIAIDMDKTHMTSRQAVVWITPVPKSVSNLQRVEIVLLGDAVIIDPNAAQNSRWFYVEAAVRGSIRVTAAKRTGIDRSSSPLYREASSHRPMLLRGGQPGRRILREEAAPAFATTQPAREFHPARRVAIEGEEGTLEKTPDGRIAAVLPGKVHLLASTEKGDYLELIANRAVVFTPYVSLGDVGFAEAKSKIEQAVTGAYVEGDVRIMRTPRDQTQPEQTVTCERAFYDFTTDRAVMTDVILHTSDPRTNVPMIVRAQMVRQLSENEYTAEHGQITTSSFHTPSYSIGARSTYIRQSDINDPITGTRTDFIARGTTFNVSGTPVFYIPVFVGNFTEHDPLRTWGFTSQRAFGFGALTEWGLFETLHRIPPRGTDATYQIDYFAKRGPAFGLNGKYIGGVADEATLEPWSYSGDFKSYLIYDSGEDDLGRQRLNVSPASEIRGRLLWRHQHFLPGDWQVQLTGAYISDRTFLEQWFNREFRTSEPYQTSLYAKHQKDTEAYTFLVSGQINDFATVSDVYQEQAEVQRLPELSYRRIGDSFFDDHATFFSANTLSVLKFRNSSESLGEMGFAPATVGFESPGIPSYGFASTQQAEITDKSGKVIGYRRLPEDATYRADFRQELDFPFTFYRFRVVPYVVGRYTPYSESLDGGSKERLMVAGGMRMTTAFWKVDDTVESTLFDLHRLRHVIEPEVNVYTSAQTVNRSKLLIYDEPIDAVTDISAVSVGLNQRWQTKRGGPGMWRSVDVFDWKLTGNFFFNQPPDSELDPRDFRGLFYVSMPEASLPRNSVNSDFTWRISDTVQILTDASYNIDHNTLATAAVGAAFRHDPRLSYYLGVRHIGVDFTETTVQNGLPNTYIFDREDLIIAAVDYELTSKYRLQLSEAYDVAQSRQNSATINFIRHFDRFFLAVGVNVDAFQSGTSSVFFNIWPEGMKPGTTYSSVGSRGGGGGLIP